MKRVVQHRVTNRFFSEGNHWVDSIDEARQFRSIEDLFEEVTRHKLRNFRVLTLGIDGTVLYVELEYY